MWSEEYETFSPAKLVDLKTSPELFLLPLTVQLLFELNVSRAVVWCIKMFMIDNFGCQKVDHERLCCKRRSSWPRVWNGRRVVWKECVVVERIR